LAIAIEPFLVAEGALGIILGAHQQNLLLSTEHGWPKKAYFRDCHGTGYTAKGVARFLPSVPLLGEDNGNLVPARMGQVLFGYYLILNTVFNVVAGLAETTAEELTLIEQLREFLLTVRSRTGFDPAFIDYLTLSPHLLQKGNFYCAWASVNENTTGDPLALYTEIPNPLFKGLA
jgi:N2-citryl-N6-acetyl-N6-hydroxylysine synthase